MTLKFYFDLLSQPSRALYIFLKITNIPFEACPVALLEGEHLTDEFKEKFNKFQKVPFIHDGNFILAESVSIFRYLCREYPVNDNWYAKDSKKQAKIDEYLEWQHMNVRFHCSSYFIAKWVNPKMFGREPNPKKIELLKNNMNDCLSKFEEYFLADGPFINGQTISFADILAACEIEQTRIAGFDPRNSHPKLKLWLERVKSECNPYYDEVHVVLKKLIKDTEPTIASKL